nr:methyl-accepting chemotaxis protein [Brevibacillus composti]
MVSQLDGMNGENRRTFELIRQLEEKTARNEQAAVQIEAIVTQLKQQAQSISDIMGTISGIADQTNLLALNASIESARAGEWGRGFAVVADEIRKLAEQSKQASDHIQRIVMAVQENSYQTVDAMQEVKASTGEQVQAARDVSEAVSTMSATIRTIAKKIEQHGQIVTGLGANAAQLVSEMEYISSIAQESAASSSQVAAVVHQQVRDYETVTISAELMNQMVAELGGTVSKFIVEGELSPIPRA